MKTLREFLFLWLYKRFISERLAVHSSVFKLASSQASVSQFVHKLLTLSCTSIKHPHEIWTPREAVTRETYGVQIVFIACHMDPISPDVRELSHRDIQPVETKMDGHHLGPSSMYPLGQMYYAA